MAALVNWGVTAASLSRLLGGVQITANTKPSATVANELIATHAELLSGRLEDLDVDVSTIVADDTLADFASIRARAWQIVARATVADLLEGMPGDRASAVAAHRKIARELLEEIRRSPGVMGAARSTGPGAPGLAASEYDADPYPPTRAALSLGDRLWRSGQL